MEKIIRKDGFVFLVQDWDKKGFETYYNLGKDPDDDRWGEQEEKPKQKKRKIKKVED
jgi:ribosomal protein L24E